MRKFANINLILLFLFTFLFSGCGLLKPSSRDKALAKERSDGKAAVREMKSLEKSHYKAQPSNTRKMMKKSRKSAEKRNRSKLR